MSGLEIYDEFGEIIFNSEGKRFFHLQGKMTSRAMPGTYGIEQYIDVPGQYVNRNCLYAFKLQTRTNRDGKSLGVALVPSHVRNRLELRWEGPHNVADPNLPSVEVYVYSSDNPITGDPGYGIEARDSQGSLVFSSGERERILQVEGYYSDLSALHDVNFNANHNGVILNSIPLNRPSAGEYGTVFSLYFRRDAGSIQARYAAVGNVFSPGSYSKPELEVLFVDLPEAVNEIPW